MNRLATALLAILLCACSGERVGVQDQPYRDPSAITLPVSEIFDPYADYLVTIEPPSIDEVVSGKANLAKPTPQMHRLIRRHFGAKRCESTADPTLDTTIRESEPQWDLVILQGGRAIFVYSRTVVVQDIGTSRRQYYHIIDE